MGPIPPPTGVGVREGGDVTDGSSVACGVAVRLAVGKTWRVAVDCFVGEAWGVSINTGRLVGVFNHGRNAIAREDVEGLTTRKAITAMIRNSKIPIMIHKPVRRWRGGGITRFDLLVGLMGGAVELLSG